jgi:two-component system response regulator AtoC
MAETLLIIEDERLLGTELQRRFARQGWDTTLARNLDEARRRLIDEALHPLVVLADMNLPDGNSLDLLEELRDIPGNVTGEWIILTAYGTIPDSVRALRLGAHDFLEKPVEDSRLELAITRAGRSARAQRRLSHEAAQHAARYGVERFVGQSQRAAETRDMLARLSQADVSALILRGDTGTGKGLAARILHYNGPRAGGPIVEVNCAALPEELLESELFGHEAGSFTGAKGRREGLFEQAHGGTLFLDEIAEMPAGLQAKLLRAVEDRWVRRVGGNREIRVDVQILVATNRDLEQAVAENAFRSDLYHRLSVFQIVLPNLAERPEDIRELVKRFVAEFNRRTLRQVEEIPQSVWERLEAYRWPGNVRELRNVVERCVLLSRGRRLEERWLQLETSGPAGAILDGDRMCFPLDGSIGLEEIERRLIDEALQRTGGNVTRAATLLGLTRQTMRYRIEKYAIDSAAHTTRA